MNGTREAPVRPVTVEDVAMVLAGVADLEKPLRRTLTLRFGLASGIRRTLEDIGTFVKVPADQVREWENDALRQLAESATERIARKRADEEAMRETRG